MVAVTAFLSHRPALPSAAGFGARWGLGHSLAVLAAGAVLLATGLHWSPEIGTILEGAVGVALVGVGAWSLRAARNLHLHPPTEHRHQDHGITAVGFLHGLAGTSAGGAPGPVPLPRPPALRLDDPAACRGGV